MLIERRSGRDRRSVQRFSINLIAEWENHGEIKRGAINDISTHGCFVACSGEIRSGRQLNIFIVLKNGKKIPFNGEVVNQVFEIGFGLRFNSLSSEQKLFLEKLINTLQVKYKTQTG